MIRQNVEIRQEFQSKIRENCKDAQDLAVQRSEEILVPQMRAISERFQVVVQANHMRTEEAFPKITEVSDQLATMRAEVQPLHQRVDHAATRLDRVAVETSTTAKDCQDLAVSFRDGVADLQAMIAEESRKREGVESNFKALLAEATQAAAAATQAAQDKADDQANSIFIKMGALEDRLQSRLDELGLRSLKEMKLGDEDVMRTLRLEIQTVNNTIQKISEENQEHADSIGRNVVANLRTEIDSAAKRTATACDRNMEQKARDLTSSMNEGFEVASRRNDSTKDQGAAALHDAAGVLRKSVAETRMGLTAEVHACRQLIANLEKNVIQVSEETEVKAVDVARRHLEDTAADIRRELSEAKRSLMESDDALRQNTKECVDEASAKFEHVMAESAKNTTNNSSLALGKAVVQLQSELADMHQAISGKLEQVRCQAADALSKEVQSRMDAFTAAMLARQAMTAEMREEVRKSGCGAVAESKSMIEAVEHRLDVSNAAIKSLENGLAALCKEHSDSSASLRLQLQTDRQHAEELNSSASQLTQQVRDNLETYLESEAVNLRAALADARKKIYDEANSLRAELREQPTKRELVELASTMTDQYNEVNKAIDGNRTRLESAMADYGTRVREARSEATEARLRMQRETMALGGELTNLRAATSSLASGVLKSLQVMGFVRDEADTSLGEGGSKESHRAIQIEDLLEWEKVGKSLATRIARQWYLKESKGISTMLAMVESKAEAEELVGLKKMMREGSPTRLNDTCSTMAPSTPGAPKSASETPPPAVTQAREQRIVRTGR